MENRRTCALPLDAPRTMGMAGRNPDPSAPRNPLHRPCARAPSGTSATLHDPRPCRSAHGARSRIRACRSTAASRRRTRGLPRRSASPRSIPRGNLDGPTNQSHPASGMVDGRSRHPHLDRSPPPRTVLVHPRTKSLVLRSSSSLGRFAGPGIPPTASVPSLGPLRPLASSSEVARPVAEHGTPLIALPPRS